MQSGAIGSSPRGRGNLMYGKQWDYLCRFIPAWAGQSRKFAERLIDAAVHPRVGGAIYQFPFMPFEGNGSSPRGRGNLYLVE